ncbi:MAG TPA: glycosyltransferase family 4 protein [Verrucomicrobiae bacterium]|nr:glycosyltransferase family 4 protein [Verrucomicrobiae bacterium]
MKIALVHKRLDLYGGTEQDFHRTAEGLRDLGHEIHLFCAEFEVPPLPGIHTHTIPTVPLGRTARLLSFAYFAQEIVRRERCDILVSFGRMRRQDILRSGGGTHRMFLKKMAEGEGPLRRLWHRMSLYHRALLALEARQFRPSGCKKIIAVSREVKREIVSTYGVPEQNIAVLYNGVDTDRFNPDRRAEASDLIRLQWGIPLDARLALFVGNGFRRKGLERLLNAWESPRLADVYLLVVGADAQQGFYRARAARSAQRKIVFAGPQAAIEKYYAAADLLVLPAFQEAFGNVVLEALASGIPVLVSPQVGAGEILNGTLARGIVETPDDPAELAERIVWLLEAERRSILSAEARSVAEHYSWNNHFRALERVLYETARLA